MLDKEIVQVAITSSICILLISLRAIYRVTKPCRNPTHIRCHRKWHVDDAWMFFGVLPLLGRAVSIAWSNSLLDQSADAVDPVRKGEDKALSSKLLLPSRIFYMLFLWSMKMCLLELYMRLSGGLRGYRIAGLAIRWSLYLTFVGVVLATLLECRPLHLAWDGDPAGITCRKARANLITMAVCNITTDIALIVFPMSLLRHSGLDLVRFLRLTILFALGSLIIVTTLVRLPLILRDNAQKTRSLWASIEIVCACVVANAAFFQAVFLDLRGGQKNHGAIPVTESTLDDRRPSRRPDTDEEEAMGIWKTTSFGVDGRETDGRETSSFASSSRTYDGTPLQMQTSVK